MARAVTALRRPESMLAAAFLGFVGVVVVLLNLVMVSCEYTGQGRSARRAAVGPGTTDPVAPLPRFAPVPAPMVLEDSIAGITGEPDIRVRIKAGVETARISCVTGMNFRPCKMPAAGTSAVGGAGGGGGLSFKPGEIIQVTVQAGEFRLTSAGGTVHGFPVDTGLQIDAAQSARSAAGKPSAAPLVVDETGYPGILILWARSDAAERAFDIVEVLGIEDYLPGVIAKELPGSWSLGAFQTQAVCARTYALHERARSRALRERYDVESSERDQVYSGRTDNRTALEAVRTTRGVILAWEGKVLRAYFSSTCGGRAAAARDTWPTGKGYEYNLAAPIQAAQRPSACEASPLFRWTVQRDKYELVRRLRAWGEQNGSNLRQIQDLHSIQAVAFDAVDRPNKYRIVEPGGKWYELAGEEIRLACNTSVQGLPAIDRTTRVSSSDFEVTVPYINAQRRKSGEKVMVTFKGRGFGHGVGMCQYCTQAMSLRGDDWLALVKRFYPGAQALKAY